MRHHLRCEAGHLVYESILGQVDRAGPEPNREVPDADAQGEPPTAQLIGRRRHLGEEERVTLRGNKHAPVARDDHAEAHAQPPDTGRPRM